MSIQILPTPGVEKLAAEIRNLCAARKFGEALAALQKFVEQVIFNPSSIAKVFTSADLDQLCKTIALQRVESLDLLPSENCRGTVILVSELSKAGGHNELIKDIVRLNLFPKPTVIVQTDCFDRLDGDISKSFAESAGVEVQRADGFSLQEKLSWLIKLLQRLPPEKLVMLAHNQDSLAVSAAFAIKKLSDATEIVYVHHGDHHLSLGAATNDFIHVDPHNIGYFHCRDELENLCNHYWPLTVGPSAKHHGETHHFASEQMITCSSGRPEKFEAGSYLYDYFELIPQVLRVTGGIHVHIGDFFPHQQANLHAALKAANVDISRIVHIPWVESVARTLLDYKVELYISSFPLAGGKATLEAMAAGIPLLMHQSYRSRFHGGQDLAYPEAFVWRNSQELLEIVGNVDSRVLFEHSTRALAHYEKFHSDDVLVASCNFSMPQDESVIPPLKPFRSDAIACFLDDLRLREAEKITVQIELDRRAEELSLYEAQAQEFQSLLKDATAKSMKLEKELDQSRASSNGRIEGYRTEIEADRLQIGRYRSELAGLVKEIEVDRSEISDFRAEIGNCARQIELERVATEKVNRALRKSLIESSDELLKSKQSRKILEETIREISADHVAMSNYLAQIKSSLREIADNRSSSSQGEANHLSNEPAVAALLTEVRDLRASTSWRVTKPLRLLARLVKKGSSDVEPKKNDLAAGIPLANASPEILASAPVQNVPEQVLGLPPDFIGDVYLKLNPDLLAAGVDAAKHYLSHGRLENRRYALPDFNVTRSERFDTALQTVFLVSHEASRTGAPILSLNLAQVLARKYNVVVLLLGGGALTPAFEATGATVMTASSVRGSPFVAHYVVTQICEQFDFEFALINSIESRPVLTVLADRFVPTISLVHEFASYTRPKEAFREALQWSSEVVFSANVTKENAFSTFPELAEASATVLPQGKCILPPSFADIDAEQREGLRLQSLIRPRDLAPETLVVLGAGFVQLRKGVDLFIECASRVKRQAGARKFRFVWIGSGYDPDGDVTYSVYLQDQIRRADLTNEVVFLGETSAIEAAYEVADLFLLSSRLDPLPNVAIDAMSQGVPVLCFDKTTGIADFLHDVGLGPHCVAGYLDTDDIASKIIGFADSRASILEIGAQCRARAAEYFNMTGYVERLEALARQVRSRVDQEAADYRTILEAEVLRPDFADMPDNAPVPHMVRRYVRTWACGIGCRKPFPGFHPGIYLERHGVAVAGSDPLADYLRSGRPEGPWNYPVITPMDARESLPAEMRVALHVHAYYVDLLPEILERLTSNRQQVDLFISVTNPESLAAVQAHTALYAGRVVSIRTVPNRGRDIGPFFTEFFADMKDDYDIVGHFHTKKSVDLKDGNMGKRWFAFLADNLLGNASCGMVDVIVDGFNRDRSIGMVFPDDPYISGMETNRRFAEPMSTKLGIAAIPEYFLYPIGTMFWARPAALQPIAALALQWEDYPPEPLPYDGSMLHALERLISLAVATDAWKIATTNVKGVTR